MAATYRRSDDVVDAQVDDDRVLLAIDSGTYFHLNAVGSHIWNVLAHPHTLEEITDLVRVEFSAPADQIANDVATFLPALTDAGLVLTDDDET